MGKCQQYLFDLSEPFTDIRALQIMNMYQILSIYLSTKKIIAKKLGDPGNLERPIQRIRSSSVSIRLWGGVSRQFQCTIIDCTIIRCCIYDVGIILIWSLHLFCSIFSNLLQFLPFTMISRENKMEQQHFILLQLIVFNYMIY